MDRVKIAKLIAQDIAATDYNERVYDCSNMILHTGLCGYENNSVVVYHAAVEQNDNEFTLSEKNGQDLYQAYIISSDGTAVLFSGCDPELFRNEKDLGMNQFHGINYYKNNYNEILKEKGFNYSLHNVICRGWASDSVTGLACLILAGKYLPFLETLSRFEDRYIINWVSRRLNIASEPGCILYSIQKSTQMNNFIPLKDTEEHRVNLHSNISGVVDTVYSSFKKYTGVEYILFTQMTALCKSDMERTSVFRILKNLTLLGATEIEAWELMGPVADYNTGDLSVYLKVLSYMIDRYGFKKTLSFLKNQHKVSFASSLEMWDECKKMCDEIGVVFTDFPEDISKTYNELIKLYNSSCNPHTGYAAKCVKKMSKRMQEYSYSKDGYTIRPVKDFKELLNEDIFLKRPSKNYGVKIAEELLNVFVLRDDNNIDKPLYTIELIGERGCFNLRQIKGRSDKNLTRKHDKTIYDVVNSWCTEFNIVYN